MYFILILIEFFETLDIFIYRKTFKTMKEFEFILKWVLTPIVIVTLAVITAALFAGMKALFITWLVLATIYIIGWSALITYLLLQLVKGIQNKIHNWVNQ